MAAPAGILGMGQFKKQEPRGAGEGTDHGQAMWQGCQARTAWGSHAGTGMPSSGQDCRDHREKRAREQQQEKV